jgi:hypothetical protein
MIDLSGDCTARPLEGAKLCVSRRWRATIEQDVQGVGFARGAHRIRTPPHQFGARPRLLNDRNGT